MELWGKGWSLRPGQDPATMEYLGMITHKGIRYRYYQDETGKILYDSEPEAGKPDWMIRADKKARKRHMKGDTK